jgi:hypothetical protein
MSVSARTTQAKRPLRAHLGDVASGNQHAQRGQLGSHSGRVGGGEPAGGASVSLWRLPRALRVLAVLARTWGLAEA